MTEEWFRSWFGPLYEELYSHRDPQEATRQVASLLIRTGRIEHPVLDAGCGAGRHLLALRDQGCRAVGVDLSRHLLSRAVSEHRGPVACGDLRHPPFRPETFGLVASFFTVFGYLDTPTDDANLFASLSALVRHGGWLFQDLPNPAHVRSNLVAHDERDIDGGRVLQDRVVLGDQVVKTITVERVGHAAEQYFERVRLWELEEIESLAKPLGLVRSVVMGDSTGSKATTASPRQAILWRKP